MTPPRVIIFGDSLSHYGPDAGPPVHDLETSPSSSSAPGVLLGAELRVGGADVRLNARVGRSAHNFWKREDTAALLAADAAWKPELVIVWLGTNDAGLGQAATTVAMARIRDAYRGMGAKVVAIGPPAFGEPDLREQAGRVVPIMRGVFGAHRFVDARPPTLDLRESPYRAADGVHFTARGASVAAPRLAREISALGGPINDWIAVALTTAIAIVLVWLQTKGGPPLI